ncbi:MAG: hypothetical protein RLY84_811, partial [Actinomycetota bacterium]
MSCTATLEALLGDWRRLLSDWAASGQLTAAAREALQLKGEPELLKRLAGQWSKGDFSGLPPIVLLPSSSMPGAAGAYAISTKNIYLNQDWLKTASHDWVMSVLTEELGHHLDGILNVVDTPGDEGEIFSRMLNKGKVPPLASQRETGYLDTIKGGLVVAEFSAINQPSPIAGFGAQRSVDFATKIIADKNGFVYVLGHASGSINGVSGSQNQDLFIAKYNISGHEIWTRVGGTEGYDFAGDMAYDSRGSFWILSSYNGAADGTGYTITRLTESGFLSDFRRASHGIGRDVPTSIAAGEENFYLSGYINDGIGFHDVYTEKYDNYGSLVWRREFSTSGREREEVNKVVVDIYGNVYVAGRTSGSIDGAYANKGDEDVFVLKYSSDGRLLYNQLFGGDKAENVSDLHVASDGSIYITGGTASSQIFGRNTGRATGYIAKLMPSGHFDWIKFVGEQRDSSFETRSFFPASIVAGGDGQIYLSGGYAERDERGSFLNTYSQAGELTGSELFGLSGSRFRQGFQVASMVNADQDYIAFTGTSQSALGEIDLFISRLDVDSLPSITLAVTPSSVTEDGSSNLTYTFTRSGSTTNPLTVNYTVGGTALLVGTSSDPADYTGISATATNRTVTFSVGASTATVTVDPTADTTVESNETVALTLASGTGYTIGTTAAVTGTIINDDVALPSITLAVSPSSVTENSKTNLEYIFTRTGDLDGQLVVYFKVGGSARMQNDYDIFNSPGSVSETLRKVILQPGSATATVTVDPKPDSEVEAEETVSFTLYRDTSYSISTSEAVTGTIVSEADIVPPEVNSIWVHGSNSLVLYFKDALRNTIPSLNRFQVLVDGEERKVTKVLVNGGASQVTLQLASPVTNGQAVTLAYTDATTANDSSGVIEDAAGNDLATFNARTVTNATPDTTAPTVSGMSVNGSALTLTLSEALKATTPAAARFR